jgi:RimJ/RimL family protein N-acetyltransferase
MKDPDLLEATASEPLSLEEEIEMQQSWRDDPKKCTFIVHATEAFPLDDDGSNSSEYFSVRDNLGGMIGDVNMFLSDMDEEEEEEELEGNNDGTTGTKYPKPLQAEIDIMIAEQSYRNKGLGRAATCSMLLYGATMLGIHRFFCKINEDNKGSIKLFESLGFLQCDYAACFKQVELELIIKPETQEVKELLEAHGAYKTMTCPIIEES